MKTNDRDKESRPFAAVGDVERQEEETPSLKSRIFEWIRVIFFAVILGLLLTNFVVQHNTVLGDSMIPTLVDHDGLIVEKVSKHFGGISRGDIVTVHMEYVKRGTDEQNIIKRVIGLPGDHLLIKDGSVWLNGEELQEDYLPEGVKTSAYNKEYADLTLAADEYYLLGDNRSRSYDSRRFGPVKKNWIMGEVLVRIWPLTRIGSP